MQSRWTVTPYRIGSVTRYLVHRSDMSEMRGMWETEHEADELASRLNFHEFGEEVFEDDYPDEF